MVGGLRPGQRCGQPLPGQPQGERPPRSREISHSATASLSCALEDRPYSPRRIEGPLSGWTANSLFRPLAVIPSARKSPRQRSVSKYSRHRPTATQRGSFSKAAAHGLAPPVGIHAGRMSAVRFGERGLPTLVLSLARAPPACPEALRREGWRSYSVFPRLGHALGQAASPKTKKGGSQCLSTPEVGAAR